MDIEDCKTLDDYLKTMNCSSVYDLTDDELDEMFRKQFRMSPYWVRPNYNQVRPLINGHSSIGMECFVDCYPGEAEVIGMPEESDYYLLTVDGVEYKIDAVEV